MRTRKSFPRLPEYGLPFFVLFGSVASFMLVGVVHSLTDGFTTWKLPVWEMKPALGIFVTVFVTLWFSFVLCFASLLFLALERVHIVDEEVQIRIGPIVLRRLLFMDIKTVIRTGGDLSLAPQSPLAIPSQMKKQRRLVLSTVPAEDLREMSRSFWVKQKIRKHNLRTKDGTKVPNQAVKRYIERRLLFQRFWLEWTPDAEETLRKHLTTSVFIL